MTATHTPSGKPALTPLQVVAQIRNDAFDRGLRLASEDLTPKEANALRAEIQEMYRTATNIEARYYADLARRHGNEFAPAMARQLVTA